MKITKRQLQKIIKEEIEAITEISGESGYNWAPHGEESAIDGLVTDIESLGDHITYTTPSGPVIMDGITTALNSGRYELVRRDIATEGVIDPETGLTDSGKTRKRAMEHVARAVKVGARGIQQLIWQLNDQWRPNAGKFNDDEIMGPDLYWQFIFNKLDRDHKEALIANTSNYDAMRAYVKEE